MYNTKLPIKYDFLESIQDICSSKQEYCIVFCMVITDVWSYENNPQ